MRAPLALLAALLSTAALAQREPASITTIPSTTPQSFDVLDKTGISGSVRNDERRGLHA